MEKKKKTVSTTKKKTNKKNTSKVTANKKVSKKKKQGFAFTLIELLAVIIILGVLMLVAIPSVTSYINNSRKDAYVTTAKQIIKGATNLVNSGDLDVYDTTATYYLPKTCINLETGGESPYGGKFDPAYILVTYDNDSFSYYWMSRDENGMGIKEPVLSTKLEANNISSGIKKEDFNPNIGIDGRNKIILYNEDCTAQNSPTIAEKTIDGETGEEITYKLCKRATVLHTARCEETGSRGCNLHEGYGNTISYGQLGTSGTLSTGDAFDCDVNGDGVYDAATERFYYVSNYYDTYTKSFDDKYAVLIYYSNTYNGQASNTNVIYHSAAESWHGPTVASQHLPSTSQWSNVSLKTSRRQILTMNDATSFNGHVLPIFEYTNRAARLLSSKEYDYKCRANAYSNCKFLLENTRYINRSLSISFGTWLENPYHENEDSALIFDSDNIGVLGYVANTVYCEGARPVIDVPIANIEK